MQIPSKDIIDKLVQWSNSIKAIAITGLSFSDDFHNRERYTSLLKIASEMFASINKEFIFDHNKFEKVNQILSKDLHSGIMGYVTPKAAVAAAVFNRDNQLLLVKSNDEDYWCLPGGWAEEQSTPAENTEREIFEETRLVVRAHSLLGVFDSRYHPFNTTVTSYTMLFACELQGGELTPLDSEVSSAGFFSEINLPPLLPGSQEQIAVSYKWKQGELIKPFFDT